MSKEFNITGSCNPEWHYMVDTTERFREVESLIERGKYFTINRARQYGKTTMLQTIRRRMSDRFLIVPLSFEGIGSTPYESDKAFVQMFARLMENRLESLKVEQRLLDCWDKCTAATVEELSATITGFCRCADRPVVVTIDEVDKSLDNQLFLNFLGMLRNKFLERDMEGMDSTFHSVILAGVYDVKNLKLKLRPDAERKNYATHISALRAPQELVPPWNIATDFNVDMTFHPEEIAQMLGDYEAYTHTGMDIKAISKEIYKYTSGYPFLVSYICKKIDEEMGRRWTSESIVNAVKQIVQGGSTLMDDLSKNLENNHEFREFMYSVSINSMAPAFTLLNPMVNMGNMFSYIRNKDGHVAIHNLVFEEALFLYFTVDYTIKNADRLSPYQMNYVRNGRLQMEYVIERFADLMHEEYRESDEAFLERQGRLLFLTFLKPIINGTGFYYVEPQTRDNRRMDLVVTYGTEEFVIELKIWHGIKYEELGRDQLADYLETRGMGEGFLVTFDFSKKHRRKDNPHTPETQEPHWIEHCGKRIFEAVI